MKPLMYSVRTPVTKKHQCTGQVRKYYEQSLLTLVILNKTSPVRRIDIVCILELFRFYANDTRFE
jgi:hypothetical protein